MNTSIYNRPDHTADRDALLIHLVNGVCGSFKTTKAFDAVGKAVTKLNLGKYIIAQPTTQLLDRWHSYLTTHFPLAHVYRFDSTTHPYNVFASITRFVTDHANDDEPCIVLTTHKTLLENPFWANQDQWHAIIDEIPQTDHEFSVNVAQPESIEFLRQFFVAEECAEINWLKLSLAPGQRAKLERWGKNEWEDDAIAIFQPLYCAFLARYTTIHVSRKSWNRMITVGHAQVCFHWCKSAAIVRGWKSITIMGANIDQSVMKKIWEMDDGVTFKPSPLIVPTMTKYTEAVGQRLRIHFFSERQWSKRLFQKVAVQEMLNNDCAKVLHPIISEVFGDNAFGWVGNLALSDAAIKGEFPRGVRIPNSPYGFNDWSHLTKCFFFSALNNTPSHFSYLQDIHGITGDELAQARSHEIAHQAIMRTDLRNHQSTKVIDVIVPDLRLGDWLAHTFPSSRLIAHEMNSAVLGSATKARGRPIKEITLTQTQRQALWRAKKKKIEQLKMDLQMGLFGGRMKTKNVINMVSFRRHSPPPMNFTLETNVCADNTPERGYLGEATAKDWNEMIAQLEEMSDLSQPTKEANTLMSGAVFDKPTGDGQLKGRANIGHINGMWFDVDEGMLTPVDWTRIFPTLQVVTFNSFNNGKSGHLKYHVLLPTKQPMPPDAYENLWDILTAFIESHGYYVGFRRDFDTNSRNLLWSGIDKSKRTPGSFYYLPCRAKLGGAHSFFTKTLDDRGLLDPMTWVNLLPNEKVQATERPAYQAPISDGMKRLRDAIKQNETKLPSAVITQRRDDAINHWRAMRGIDEQRNREFFLLGLKLKKLGDSNSEIEATLKREAANSSVEEKRKKRERQIKSIMGTLDRLKKM